MQKNSGKFFVVWYNNTCMIDDVIVAIATPIGKSGVGVIRLSGKDAFNVGRKMFVPFNKNADFLPNKMVLGKINFGISEDKGYFVYFKAPHSYTGEDVVEFQCHGGIAVTQNIVDKALSCGARMAEPGEFSKRAFLNGKLTLDQAEGVIDTINAESKSELKAGSELVRGALTRKVVKIQDKLTDLISEIEVNLDYPEHDIEYKTKENLKIELEKIEDEIKELLKTSRQGKLIKNGVNISIIGKTNVGKSSLLNVLVNEDVAIVTDIEGTTRDVVIGSIEYKGMKFNFLDTAGLRKTKDIVENIGIEKTKQAIDRSDIVLLVLDSSKALDEQDENNFKLIKDKKSIVLLNKCDLPDAINYKGESIKLSAKNKVNTEELKDKIYNMAIDGCDINNRLILTNSRHVQTLEQARDLLNNLIINILDVPLDCSALDIRELWEKLGEITGESANEKIIDKIFSKFCLGK